MVTGDTGTLSGLAPIIPSSNIGKKCSVIRQAEIDLYYLHSFYAWTAQWSVQDRI